MKNPKYRSIWDLYSIFAQYVLFLKGCGNFVSNIQCCPTFNGGLIHHKHLILGLIQKEIVRSFVRTNKQGIIHSPLALKYLICGRNQKEILAKNLLIFRVFHN